MGTLANAMRSLIQSSFLGWRAIVLHDSGLTLRIVPEVGGRLMSIQMDDCEMCFIHPTLQGRVFGGAEDQWKALCQDAAFPLWGGGKTWVAPESDWPMGAPHRDLDSLPWMVERSWINEVSMGVAVRSPVCSVSGLQIRRTLTLPAGRTDWTLDHELFNASHRSVTCGMWDVLMLRRPAHVSLPGLAPSQIMPLPGKPSVSFLVESGVIIPTDGGSKIYCAKPAEFKCGFSTVGGRVQVAFDDMAVRYARSSAVPPSARYAHGHPFEVFNAPELPYFEVETHSPMQTLNPSDCIRYSIHECVSRI